MADTSASTDDANDQSSTQQPESLSTTKALLREIERQARLEKELQDEAVRRQRCFDAIRDCFHFSVGQERPRSSHSDPLVARAEHRSWTIQRGSSNDYEIDL